MDRTVFEAAESGDLDSIKGLIMEPQNLEQLVTPHNNDTVLHVAVRSGNRRFAEQAVQLCPGLLSRPNSAGETPLHAAARAGPAMASLLLGAAAAGDSAVARARDGERGDTALHVAVRHGGAAVARLLVAADPEMAGLLNRAGESPLFLAVEGGFGDIARFIVDECRSAAGPPVYDGPDGMNALHAAVIRTHRARILEHDVPDLSLENLRGLIRSFVLHIEEYLLGWSSRKSETGMIELFLEREESQKIGLLEKQDKIINWTPLHFAAHLGHLEAAKLMLDHNCSRAAYLKDKHGMSPLHVAAREGHVRVVGEIVRQRPEACDAVDAAGRTALHVAVAHGRLGVVRYVLATPKLGFLLNAADAEGNTALHLALGQGCLRVMKALLDDVRVAKRATNLDRLNPTDILRANADIGELTRCWFMKKLESQGGQESLQSIVQRVEQSNNQSPTKPSPVHTAAAEDRATKSRRLKKISSAHLLVAALIATVTFTAAFTIPGGYRDGDGQAVLWERPFFGVFVVADSAAFLCASTAVLLQFFISVEHNYHLLLRFARFAATFTYVSVVGMVVAFASGLRVVMPGSSWLAVHTVVVGAFSVFLILICCL